MAEGKKNARKRGAWIVFQDESGISTTPAVRRTWAPKGRTPILRHPFNWKRISLSAALCYHPDGGRCRLVFDTKAGAYDQASLMDFLRQLRRELRGKVTLVWDGLPSHRSNAMKAFVVSQRSWLVVEQLPGYAPDLNPVELLWGNIKGTELANRCEQTLAGMLAAAKKGIDRVRRNRRLPFAFLRHAGLSL